MTHATQLDVNSNHATKRNHLFRPATPEGGYEARALGFSVFTQADTLDELKNMIRDAVSCHFDPADKPIVIRLRR